MIVSERLIESTHTASEINIDAYVGDLLSEEGLEKALDCDSIFSCVDRPWPRHMLNLLAYSHFIPVVDGGILAKVNDKGSLIHANWRVHTISPGRPCMVCLGALRPDHVALDREGLLDDQNYIEGLTELEVLTSRQNVFPFSLSTAAHEILQLLVMLLDNNVLVVSEHKYIIVIRV